MHLRWVLALLDCYCECFVYVFFILLFMGLLFLRVCVFEVLPWIVFGRWFVFGLIL